MFFIGISFQDIYQNIDVENIMIHLVFFIMLWKDL
jgi:hypothetical protein